MPEDITSSSPLPATPDNGAPLQGPQADADPALGHTPSTAANPDPGIAAIQDETTLIEDPAAIHDSSLVGKKSEARFGADAHPQRRAQVWAGKRRRNARTTGL